MISLSKLILIGALQAAGMQTVDSQNDFLSAISNEDSIETLRMISSEEEITHLRALEAAKDQMNEDEIQQHITTMVTKYGEKLKSMNAPWAM